MVDVYVPACFELLNRSCVNVGLFFLFVCCCCCFFGGRRMSSSVDLRLCRLWMFLCQLVLISGCVGGGFSSSCLQSLEIFESLEK